MNRFGLDDIQAQAILDMQLKRLQGLEEEKLQNEFDELQKKIAYYNQLLSDETMLKGVLKDELIAIRDKYGDERRTEIMDVEDDLDIEDLIEEEECVFTLTHGGYIKRTPVAPTAQRRGQGRQRPDPEGGGLCEEALHLLYPRLHPVLHQHRQGASAQGLSRPGGQPHRQRARPSSTCCRWRAARASPLCSMSAPWRSRALSDDGHPHGHRQAHHAPEHQHRPQERHPRPGSGRATSSSAWTSPTAGGTSCCSPMTA